MFIAGLENILTKTNKTWHGMAWHGMAPKNKSQRKFSYFLSALKKITKVILNDTWISVPATVISSYPTLRLDFLAQKTSTSFYMYEKR